MSVVAKGQSGTVEFDGAAITITRPWHSAQGRSSKRIPLRHVTSVQHKPAGRVFRGFVSFSLGGGDELRSQVGRQGMDAYMDENSVVFGAKAREDFARLVDAINAALDGKDQS